jgi:iron(III) transport system permease protein
MPGQDFKGLATDRTRAFALWPAWLSDWRERRRSSPAWTIVPAVLVAVILAPILAVVLIALGGSGAAIAHLSGTVLASAALHTFMLAFLCAVLTLVMGTATAWLITMYRFPGRAILDRLLVLPLAMPTYIVAYCYADALDYAGPVQSALRSAFGWQTAADYWFPEVRSIGGAALILASVLYPYVYLTARASFVQQSVCALEVARTLGQSAMGTFWAIALPLARPALAAGVALVAMEVFNEFGAVRHLGVSTLSSAIYDTWLQRSDLAGAAQIAVVVLGFVLAALLCERSLRGGALSHHTTGRYRSIPFQDIDGIRGYIAATLCALPFLFGFLIPALILINQALRHGFGSSAVTFFEAAKNSALLATLAAIIAVLIAVFMSYARRVASNGLNRVAVRAAGFGYAVPGTVLALGLLIPLAALDNRIDAVMRSAFGISTGLLLSGSIFAITLAYVIRFLAVALSAIESGLDRISPNLDAAARSLGETALSALRRVHVPILMPALGAAGLLVFVDAMKELPATLLLRPFDFETLATQVYGFAALEQVEQGAVCALAIVATGLIPVLWLHNAVAGGRAGQP